MNGLMTELPIDVLRGLQTGLISAEAGADLLNAQSILYGDLSGQKQASIAPAAPFAGAAPYSGLTWRDAGKAALVTTAINAGIALGAGAVQKGLDMAVDKITYGRDLKKIKEVDPTIANHDPKMVDLAYRSLRKLSKEQARDPLMGANYLRATLQNTDPLDPTAPPRMDPAIAKVLAETGSKLNENGREIRQALVSAGQAGALTGERFMLQARQEQQNHLSRQHDFSRDANNRLFQSRLDPLAHREDTRREQSATMEKERNQREKVRETRDVEAHGWNAAKATRDVEAHGWNSAKATRDGEAHGWSRSKETRDGEAHDWNRSKETREKDMHQPRMNEMTNKATLHGLNVEEHGRNKRDWQAGRAEAAARLSEGLAAIDIAATSYGVSPKEFARQLSADRAYDTAHSPQLTMGAQKGNAPPLHPSDLARALRAAQK